MSAKLTERDTNFIIRQIFGEGFIAITSRCGSRRGPKAKLIVFIHSGESFRRLYQIAQADSWEDAIAKARTKVTVSTN